MIIRPVGRIVIFLLLFFFLQSWRLVASTPGAEDFLRYVAEEGEFLVQEITGEDAPINQPQLNAAEVGPHAITESAFVETSPMDVDSIGDSTFSLPELKELVLQKKQRVASRDEIFMDQVSLAERANPIIPQVFNLGNRVLALPSELIFQFLRSPEAKQAAYKAEHQQAVQELQLKYPDLSNKITSWENAVEEWSECRIPKEQEALYQNIVKLASSMPSKLYELVALSQAMKIIADAIAYTHYLPHAWKKYNQNQETEEAKIAAARAKIILLSQIDTINNNIENLEQAADAVIKLSEQRNRCYLSTDVAIAVEGNYHTNRYCISAAVAFSEGAISNYCQFAHKMKEGDVSEASLLRRKGFYLECDALQKEYSFQKSAYGSLSMKGKNFSAAVGYAALALKFLQRETEEKNNGKIDIAKVYRQGADYYFQAALAAANGDETKVKNFSAVASSVEFALKFLKQEAEEKNNSKIDVAKVYRQEADYYFQAAFAAANGDETKVKNFSTAAVRTGLIMVKAVEKLTQAKNEGKIEVAKILKQGADYYLQMAQASVAGDEVEAVKFIRAGRNAERAAEAFEKAIQAKSENNIQAMQDFEQVAYYHLRSAEVYAQEGNEKGKAFSREVYEEELKQSLEVLKAERTGR